MRLESETIRAMISILVIFVAINVLSIAYILHSLYFKKIFYNKYKRKNLFSKNEKRLYYILLQRLKNKSNKYYVLAHVRLNDLFEIVKDKDWRETWDIWVQWHVDFLIIDSLSLEPKLAIELDWWSHILNPSQKKMDNYKDMIFSKYSNIPLKRLQNKQLYKWEQTIKDIDNLVSCL